MATATMDQDTGWRALFGSDHRAEVTVLAGGVLLFAMNVYLTSSLLPSAIADIGGARLYAWVMTAFLVAAVVSSMFVTRLVATLGGRSAYLLAFALFGVGSLIAAVTPSMPVLLVGRAVQGLGGGLLAGLGFAVIRQTLPERLWSRSLGLNSAMWGVGNLVGPSVGGLFAQLHLWRWAMALLVVLSVGLGLLAARSMPTSTHGDASLRVPGVALAAVSAAAAVVSVAGVRTGVTAVVLLVVAGLLLVGFVLRDRSAPYRILPRITYQSGNALKWIYLSIALLAAVSTVEAFVPLFGQELGRLGPLLAGLLGAALSWGWSATAIASSNVDDLRRRAWIRVAGPIMLAVGLGAYALLQRDAASWTVIGLWTLSLILAGGGIGMAFQHGITAAMSATDDPDEATRAATGVNTVQLMSNAIGSAVAGVLVNLGSGSTVRSAHILLWAFAAVAVVGVATALRANARLAGATR